MIMKLLFPQHALFLYHNRNLKLILRGGERLRIAFQFSIGRSDKKVSCLATCAILLALCVPVNAQQTKNVPSIGFLRPGPPAQEIIDALRLGLSEFGYTGGEILRFNTAGRTVDRSK